MLLCHEHGGFYRNPAALGPWHERSSITTKTEPDQVGDDLQQNRQGRGKNDLFYYFDVSMWRQKVSVMEENLPMLRLKEKRK